MRGRRLAGGTMTGRLLEVIGRVDDLGRCGWEIRRGLLYRVWKEVWMLKYLGRSARYQ